MDELQKKIVDYVEANGKTYQQIALEIHEKPEVSNYEFFASKRLADQIKSVGFEVEMPAEPVLRRAINPGNRVRSWFSLRSMMPL